MPAELVRIQKKRQLSLIQDYDLLSEELSMSEGALTRKRIKRRLEAIEKEIEELEQKIGNQGKTCYEHWDEQLPHIDFINAYPPINKILDRFRSREGAALLLLPEYKQLAGGLIRQRINDDLRRLGREFQVYPIGFAGSENLTRLAFLNKMANLWHGEPLKEETVSKGQHPEALLEDHVEAMVEAFCNMLQRGAIRLIDVTLHDVRVSETFIPWLLNHVWSRLVQKLPQMVHTYRQVNFLMVITVNNSVEYLPAQSLCEDYSHTNCEKILIPPMINIWDKDIIADWLLIYSGLQPPNWTDDAILTMADNIYFSTRGRPGDVWTNLLERKEEVCKE